MDDLEIGPDPFQEVQLEYERKERSKLFKDSGVTEQDYESTLKFLRFLQSNKDVINQKQFKELRMIGQRLEKKDFDGKSEIFLLIYFVFFDE